MEEIINWIAIKPQYSLEIIANDFNISRLECLSMFEEEALSMLNTLRRAQAVKDVVVSVKYGNGPNVPLKL